MSIVFIANHRFQSSVPIVTPSSVHPFPSFSSREPSYIRRVLNFPFTVSVARLSIEIEVWRLLPLLIQWYLPYRLCHKCCCGSGMIFASQEFCCQSFLVRNHNTGEFFSFEIGEVRVQWSYCEGLVCTVGSNWRRSGSISALESKFGQCCEVLDDGVQKPS